MSRRRFWVFGETAQGQRTRCAWRTSQQQKQPRERSFVKIGAGRYDGARGRRPLSRPAGHSISGNSHDRLERIAFIHERSNHAKRALAALAFLCAFLTATAPARAQAPAAAQPYVVLIG